MEYKTVVVEMKINVLVKTPIDSKPEDTEFFLNESSHCADNEIKALAENLDVDMCISCANTEFKFIRDANQYDLMNTPKAFNDEGPQIRVSDIVNVALTNVSTMPVYRPKYSVLLDKSCEEVIEFAKSHPSVFVFPFCTGEVEDVPDYTNLSSGEKHLDHVLQPFYVGNLSKEDQKTVIHRMIRNSFRDYKLEDLEEIK